MFGNGSTFQTKKTCKVTLKGGKKSVVFFVLFFLLPFKPLCNRATLPIGERGDS